MQAIPLLLVPLLLHAAPATPSAAAVAALAPQDAKKELLEKIRQAQKIGATDDMARLVRQNESVAVQLIMNLCWDILRGPTPQLEDDIAAMRKAWRGAYGSAFADRVYEYFSLLPGPLKDEYWRVSSQFSVMQNSFLEAEAAKDVPRMLGIAAEVEGKICGVLEELGDQYAASSAWLLVANANDESRAGERANLRKAHDAYAKALKAREAIDLKDSTYSLVSQRVQTLAAMGFGEQPAAGGGGGGDGGGAAAAAPGATPEPSAGAKITAATTFELVEDVNAYVRPTYYGDEAYGSWAVLFLRGKGSEGRFPTMQTGPRVTRTEPAEVMIDQDGDGEHDVELPTPGRITPVTITLGSGEDERQWAFLSMVGGQQDTYNGIRYNMTPDDNQISIYISPAASVVTQIGGVDVRIFDDNMDGVYGSAPLQFAYVGTLEGSYQCEMDSMSIDGSKHAVPWSEYQKIGDRWYKLSSAKGGREIEAVPVEGLATATLKLSYKGPDVAWMVVRGSGDYENCFFDVAANAAGVEVPAGRYKLYSGLVSEGKKQQVAKALVLPGEGTQEWTAAPGEKVEVELGAPFGFDFELRQAPDTVTVVGKTVVVTGRGGETYQRLWNCVVEPEVSIREAGSKRGSKPEDMKRIGVQEDIEVYGFEYLWFPLDLELPKSDEDVPYEAQLVEKKNELFGKIESAWKG